MPTLLLCILTRTLWVCGLINGSQSGVRVLLNLCIQLYYSTKTLECAIVFPSFLTPKVELLVMCHIIKSAL